MDVQELNAALAQSYRIDDTSHSIISTPKRNWFVAAALYLVMGIFFVVWGVWYGSMLWFATALGLCFIGYGIYVLVRARRIAPTPPHPQE